VRSPRLTQQGFTLAELLFVVFVLAVIAAITIPPRDAGAERRLEQAAGEVADALIFARGESLRTSADHGVRIEDGKRLRVFRLDASKGTPTEVYDVRHPVDKNPYDVDLASETLTRGTRLTGHFLFQRDGTADAAVSFDANGEAVRGRDARPLATGGVLIDNEGLRISVAVAPLTGRVSIGPITAASGVADAAFAARVQP
jgi:prepilin-type N-terminal cleavage/methylation domain-containing protein